MRSDRTFRSRPRVTHPVVRANCVAVTEQASVNRCDRAHFFADSAARW